MENSNDGMLESLRNVIRLHEQREIVFRNKEAMLLNSANEREKSMNRALNESKEALSRSQKKHFQEKEELLQSFKQFLLKITEKEKKEKELLESVSALLVKEKTVALRLADKDKLVKELKEALINEKSLWEKRFQEEKFKQDIVENKRKLLLTVKNVHAKPFEMEKNEFEKKWEMELSRVKECVLRLADRLKVNPF